jgi:hypothetical protein
MLGPSGCSWQWSSSRPIKITNVRKKMDPPNSLVMKIIVLFWVEDGNHSNILIGHKKFHHSHRWRIKSSSNPIGSWKERRPLIGRRDFHKLSLAKEKQVRGGVLWVAPWIYDFLLMLKEKDLWFGEDFWWKRGVRLKGKKKCYYKTNLFFLESSLWTFCSKFKISWLQQWFSLEINVMLD